MTRPGPERTSLMTISGLVFDAYGTASPTAATTR
jgi:hypothetical protein